MLGFLATWLSIPGVKLGSLNTISRAWHRLHVFARLAQTPWFPGLDRTNVFVTPSHCFKKGTLHTYTLWPIKKSFSSHVGDKTNKRLAWASEAAVFYRVLGNHKAYNLFYKVTEHTFCSQSSRIFLICCRLFPSSSNAAGLFTDSVHLVSTGSPTFYMRKRKFWAS